MFGDSLEPLVDTGLIHFLVDQPALVQQRGHGLIFHRLAHSVFVDEVAKLADSLFVFFKQRGTGKADVTSDDEDLPHFGVDRAILDTARSLGASGFQTAIVVLREARFAVIAAVIMGFGRAISEVGISLMVGGNIVGFTRVITTAISLEASKGELELALALGIILIFIALVINISLNRLQQR